MEHLQSSLQIRFEQYSDAGRKPENQDTVGARIPTGSQLTTKGIAIAIADGVSSSQAAKQASQTAITGFINDYYATPDTWRTRESCIKVLQSLNNYLWGQSQNSIGGEGHLTTFSALILKGNKYFIFHVGDSRIYRWRDGNLEQLTRDHTQKIDQQTTYLSRALGADLHVEIDFSIEEVAAGDVFVLSTDGIHDTLNHAQLTSLIQAHHTEPEVLTKMLSDKALAQGSSDNISVQVACIEHVGAASHEEALTVLSKRPFPPLLSVGNTLDGMEVKRILHESERSQVYLVEDIQGALLVMKTPSPNYEDDVQYIERFVMESWLGARIHNVHVVRVVQPRQVRSCLYYLTEYVSGPTLTQLIKERAPVAISDAIDLTEQLIKGVRGFHRKDTLHQDLKPDNVIIGKNGVMILDFGSCWAAGFEEIQAPYQRDKILGTLSYSAPEYRFGGAISQRSDQFSLAILLYEMLTGKHPYGEKYQQATSLKSFMNLSYQSACLVNPLVPFWLDKALEKALSIQPQSRYPVLSEWLYDLKQPNPQWLKPDYVPLYQRNPKRIWQVLACAGWALAIYLLLLQNIV